MGELTPIALSRRSMRGRNKFESSARLINCYAEMIGGEGKSEFALYAINGWESYATLTGASGGVRAMLPVNNELLCVAGRQFYSVSPSQTATLVGGIASDGLVTMARNAQANPQTVVVCDGLWYVYQNGVLELGNDPDLPPPIYVVVKDGYFIFIHENGRFTISDLNDVTVDGLAFASAEANPDGGIAAATRGTDLIIFGSQSMEFWNDTGAADFAFERVAYRNFGCYTAGSVAEITALIENQTVDSVIWAATDEKGAFTGIYLLNGYTAQKISTPEVDRNILDDASPDGIRAFAWSEDSHVFYTIKGTNYSHTYDTTTGFWHERKSKSTSYWKASCHATFDRKTIFGDDTAGTLYRSGRDLYDAAGETVIMEMWMPIVHAFPYEIIANRFVIDAVTGVGLNSSDAHLQDPQVTFDVSFDGGATFGTERSRDLGKQGQVLQNIDWWGIGPIPRTGAVFRVRISAGVKRCVMSAAIDADRLAA